MRALRCHCQGEADGGYPTIDRHSPLPPTLSLDISPQVLFEHEGITKSVCSMTERFAGRCSLPLPSLLRLISRPADHLRSWVHSFACFPLWSHTRAKQLDPPWDDRPISIAQRHLSSHPLSHPLCHSPIRASFPPSPLGTTAEMGSPTGPRGWIVQSWHGRTIVTSTDDHQRGGRGRSANRSTRCAAGTS